MRAVQQNWHAVWQVKELGAARPFGVGQAAFNFFGAESKSGLCQDLQSSYGGARVVNLVLTELLQVASDLAEFGEQVCVATVAIVDSYVSGRVRCYFAHCIIQVGLHLERLVFNDGCGFSRLP